jgi:predicted N-acetyltransferase YhbS
VEIRDARPADAPAIRRLTERAFAGAEHASGTEADIIDTLRRTGRLTLSLVATAGDEVVGHAAFSPVTIAGAASGWHGLGPVAVLPERQGAGIGAALIRAGLARLRAAGCVVHGEPAYYTRLGFAWHPGLRFDGAPAEYFLALPFTGPPPSGAVVYQPAFYGPPPTP